MRITFLKYTYLQAKNKISLMTKDVGLDFFNPQMIRSSAKATTRINIYICERIVIRLSVSRIGDNTKQ